MICDNSSYPLYRKGNPQLRVYLPNLWMKLVNPEHAARPPNKVRIFLVATTNSSSTNSFFS